MRIPRLVLIAATGAALSCSGILLGASDASARVIVGKIQYIGNNGKTVHIMNKTYPISDRAKILISGKPANADQLRSRLNCKIRLVHKEAQQMICTKKPMKKGQQKPTP